MPSKSPKQARLMRAVAHNPGFAKKVGIPTSVGKDFAAADKRRGAKFSTRAGINRPDTSHGKLDLPNASLRKYSMKEGGTVMRSKRDIAADQMAMAPFKKGGPVKESKSMMRKEVGFMKKAGAPKSMIKHEMKEAGYARGGGIESRGKTKGKMIKMARGGKAC